MISKGRIWDTFAASRCSDVTCVLTHIEKGLLKKCTIWKWRTRGLVVSKITDLLSFVYRFRDSWGPNVTAKDWPDGLMIGPFLLIMLDFLVLVLFIIISCF